MHPILKRQLKKLGIIDLERSPSSEQWQMFIEAVSQSYKNADEDRTRLERSLDVSSREMRHRMNEIKHQALHDKLTGLPNRALFLDRLQLAMSKNRRNPFGTTLLFIDLDNFKLINDSLGHHVGDQLLQAISDHLWNAVRPGDTVARLGGDEFTIILEDQTSTSAAEVVASRLLDSLSEPLSLEGTEVFAALSIGIAYAPNGLIDDAELIRMADAAMYRSKSQGGNCLSIYDETMANDALNQLELETALRRALENREISVLYQPFIDLASGGLIGAEALARWHRGTSEAIPPAVFIPVAEETGLIVPIGYWVLEHACEQAKEWIDTMNLDQFAISVNLSGKQLERKDVVQQVKDILQRTGLAPTNLKLEVTESILMWNRADVCSKLQELKDMGIAISVDDFGTGYSSLSVLSSLPIDTVKIDRSFVAHAETDAESRAIVEAVLGLAKNLKLGVIAEGIESEGQRSLIHDMGCATGQGFLFDKPLKAEEIRQRLLAIRRTLQAA